MMKIMRVSETLLIKSLARRERRRNTLFNTLNELQLAYGSIIDTSYTDSLYWKEQHLYGSSRLGMAKPNIEVTNYRRSTITAQTSNYKNYELTNHLGNVLATIKDEKQQKDDNNDGIVDYYEPIVMTATDYYPFGMPMPNRSFTLAPSEGYRFGFNTQEKDDEVYGAGNLNTAQFWEYDTRIGRRWNTDPVVKVWESPYLVNSGNPIIVTDPLGDDGKEVKDKDGKNTGWEGDVLDKDGNKSNGKFTLDEMNKKGLRPNGKEAEIGGKRRDLGDKIRSAITDNPNTGPMDEYFKPYFQGKPSGIYNDKRFTDEFWGSLKMEIGLSAGSAFETKFMGNPYKIQATLAEASVGNFDNSKDLDLNLSMFSAETNINNKFNVGLKFADFKTTMNSNESNYQAAIGKVDFKLLSQSYELNNSLSLFKIQNNGIPFSVLNNEINPKINLPDKTIGVSFTFGIKLSLGVDFYQMFNSFKYF